MCHPLMGAVAQPRGNLCSSRRVSIRRDSVISVGMWTRVVFRLPDVRATFEFVRQGPSADLRSRTSLSRRRRLEYSNLDTRTVEKCDERKRLPRQRAQLCPTADVGLCRHIGYQSKNCWTPVISRKHATPRQRPWSSKQQDGQLRPTRGARFGEAMRRCREGRG